VKEHDLTDPHGRTPHTNPFTPGFGNLPRVFAGRSAELHDLGAMVSRLAAGIYEQPRLVTGDRGVGKTTLLRELEDEQRADGRWVVRAAATVGDAVIARLMRGLSEVLRVQDLEERLSRTAGTALARLAGLEVGGVSVALQPPAPADRGADLARLLSEAALLARERGTVLLVLVDEAQNISPAAMGDLFFAVQEAQTTTVATVDEASGVRVRDSAPLGVVVAGLPGLVARLKQAGSTFGERSKPVPLGAFGDADVREGLRAFAAAGGARFDEEALQLVTAATGGYPYFLHVVGSHVWNAGSSQAITRLDAERGIAEARRYLDAFYEERLRELGDRQLQYLAAAARLPAGERAPARIAGALGTTSQRLGSTASALASRHGLLRSEGGRLAFALPGLDDYLRRRED